jgi:hypothetical protein
MKIQKEYTRSSAILGVVLALTLAASTSAHAQITPTWNVTGNYTWLVLGTYAHDLSITVQNPDGTFSGTGGYPAGGPYQTTETISGQVVGSAITLTTLYAGPMNPGYTVTATGTIAADGTMSGANPWEWHMTSGMANFTSIPDWGQQLSAASCVGKTGNPVVNINEKVVNDADSGFAGNWALDSFVRHIQVWQIGKNSGAFCALVTYEGNAAAVAGAIGPAGTGTIGSGVSAVMKGGSRSVFTGTLRTAPLWQTKGSVGTVDYNCNVAGDCSGKVDWLSQYFSTTAGFNDAWWGWFYDAGSDGSWLNSSEGSFGNIL